jgi:hypothetical protein
MKPYFSERSTDRRIPRRKSSSFALPSDSLSHEQVGGRWCFVQKGGVSYFNTGQLIPTSENTFYND